MPEPRVLALVPRGSESCAQWRIWWPAKAFKEHGYIYDWLYFEEYREKIEPAIASGKYNIIVTPRFACQERWMVQRFQYLMQKYHLAWIYEIDDDWFSPEIVQRHVEYTMTNYRRRGRFSEPEDDYEAGVRWEGEYLQQEKTRILSLVDAITVTSEPLANVVQKHTNVPVKIIPNAIDIAWFKQQVTKTERRVEPLTVGWSGGWRFESDLKLMAEAWGRLAKRFPQVTFVLHGGWAVPTIIRKIPIQQLRLLSWSKLDDYPAMLKNIDIACCSVSQDAWNECKTPIKWMEASLAGSACVGTHALYARAITHDYNGLLATTVDEWEYNIARLIEDADLRRQLQRNALLTIEREHTLAAHWSEWLHVCHSALEATYARTS